MKPPAPRHIALVGLPGSGKTTVGQRLAEQLDWQFRDTDAAISERTGRSPASIIDEDGEVAFRRFESEVIAELLEAPRPTVIACGGGLFSEPEPRRRLLDAVWVVMLDAADPVLAERLGDAEDRPLLRGDVAGRLAKLRRLRQSAFAQAHMRLDTSRMPLEAAVASLGALADSVAVPLGAAAYPIVVGEGATDHLASHLPSGCHRVAVICDNNVEIFGRRLAGLVEEAGMSSCLIGLDAGEGIKSWAATGELVERLAAEGLGRHDCVVAVGGGSVGDVAGFAAAVYCRGIAWVVVPTTLLAMVDSAIGGKTAVNLSTGKNLAGAFWQPRAVLCDPTLLDTLPARQLRSGLGEVAKYAMIDDGDLGDILNGSLDRLRDGDVACLSAVIERCAAIKAEVVGGDAGDSGWRAVLNYGHTVAHAIEAATGYGVVSHGEAVAAGMRVAGRLSIELLGCPAADIEWQDALLDALELHPLPRLDPGAVLERLGNDKKSVAGHPRWVLLARRGEPLPAQIAPATLVRESLIEVLPA